MDKTRQPVHMKYLRLRNLNCRKLGYEFNTQCEQALFIFLEESFFIG